MLTYYVFIETAIYTCHKNLIVVAASVAVVVVVVDVGENCLDIFISNFALDTVLENEFYVKKEGELSFVQ